MSLLGPVLFAALMLVPAWMANLKDTKEKTIAIVDETAQGSVNILTGDLPETDFIKFKYLPGTDIETVKRTYTKEGYYGVLYIPSNIISSNTAILYTEEQPSYSMQKHISGAIEEEIEKQKLIAENINNLDEIMKRVQTNINLRNIIWNEAGEEKESNTGIAMGIGYAGGMLIYFFIFLYGAMVMRGVIEEKTNRIVEVIISSVKPFQLMMGKIVGVGLVALTQFVIWVVLTLLLVTGLQKTIMPEKHAPPDMAVNVVSPDIMNQNSKTSLEYTDQPAGEPNIVQEVFSSMGDINFGLILGMFIFYFLGGFLLYASFFAIIGSAVDNETETQQFMLPVTIPLILGIFVMINTIENPSGPLAFWFSMIPLTSPIVMMVRIPFEPPVWQLALSALILVLTFIGSVWMAGKIYRTGILMYGKKVNYAEIWKWLRYKN